MKFLRAEEILDITGTSSQTLKNWKNKGSIVSRYLPGNFIYYDVDSIGSKGLTGHYLADHTINSYYKSDKFNEVFMSIIL